MNFKEEMSEKKKFIDLNLENVFDQCNESKILIDAMKYSLFANGKRIRPILVLSSNELLSGDNNEAVSIACGVEMIHTYSLIHDDLPSMDDDDMRRGRPTNHKVFGDAFALLAGDGLLSYAFEYMLKEAQKYKSNLYNHIQSIYEISKGAGINGMVAGQCHDIENENKEIDQKELYKTHSLKTGAMITASLTAGLMLNNPDKTMLDAIRHYGYCLGLSFQIVDDILDVIGDEKKTGKSMSDSKNEKNTFPILFGMDKSKAMVKELTEESIESLKCFGLKNSFLINLSLYLGQREY